jgi:hypothetical protein
MFYDAEDLTIRIHGVSRRTIRRPIGRKLQSHASPFTIHSSGSRGGLLLTVIQRRLFCEEQMRLEFCCEFRGQVLSKLGMHASGLRSQFKANRKEEANHASRVIDNLGRPGQSRQQSFYSRIQHQSGNRFLCRGTQMRHKTAQGGRQSTLSSISGLPMKIDTTSIEADRGRPSALVRWTRHTADRGERDQMKTLISKAHCAIGTASPRTPKQWHIFLI